MAVSKFNRGSSSPSAGASGPDLKLSDFNFELVEEEPIQGARIASYGLPESGKSHFGLSGPGPVDYITFDKGDRPPVRYWIGQGKEIRRARVVLPADVTNQLNLIPSTQPKKSDAVKQKERENADAAKAVYGPIWKKVKSLSYQALESDSRTVVIDTGTHALNICRLAHFGKMTQIPPSAYAMPNADYENWLDMFSDDKYLHKHVIVTHQMTKQYKDDKWNGKYEFKGHSQTFYIFDTVLQFERLDKGTEKGKLVFTVEKCKDHRELEYEVYDALDWDFASFMMEVHPDSNPEDWE